MDNNMDGYPARMQANGIVPSRPQSHLRGNSINDNVMGDQIQGPPPAYSIGNGAAGGGGSYSNPVQVQQQPSRGHRDRDHNTSSQSQVPRESSKPPRNRDLTPEALNAIPKILKIAVVGDSTVGKTLICQAATSETFSFNKNYHLTCGVSVYPKSIKLPDRTENSSERVNMALLDSSGKDIYLDYLPKYWDKLDGVVVVIDLTNKTSLQNASEWFRLAASSIPQKADLSGGGDLQSKGILGVLIGNKMDLTERRSISPKIAQDFASKHNLQYFECSVKENSGIEEPFFYLAHQWAVGFLGSSSSSSSFANDKENTTPHNNS